MQKAQFCREMPINYIEAMNLNCDPIINNTMEIVKYRHWKHDFKQYEKEIYKSKNMWVDEGLYPGLLANLPTNSGVQLWDNQ